MDTLGFEPRAFRMRSGCDATTPCALECILKFYAYIKKYIVNPARATAFQDKRHRSP